MLETPPWPEAALAYRRVLGLVDAIQQLALMGGCQQLTRSQDANLYNMLSAAPRAPHANEPFALPSEDPPRANQLPKPGNSVVTLLFSATFQGAESAESCSQAAACHATSKQALCF